MNSGQNAKALLGGAVEVADAAVVALVVLTPDVFRVNTTGSRGVGRRPLALGLRLDAADSESVTGAEYDSCCDGLGEAAGLGCEQPDKEDSCSDDSSGAAAPLFRGDILLVERCPLECLLLCRL